jgi:hypothetical protein
MTVLSNSIFVSFTGILFSIFLLSTHAPVEATALSYKIDANERACFYAWVDKVGEKIAFYFAVLFPSRGNSDVVGPSRWIIRY